MPFNTKIYNVNWNKLTAWLIPDELFKAKVFVLCKSMIVFVSTIHIDFLNFRKQKMYELAITPQICWLVLLLNDRFDFVQRRIYIEDGAKGDNVYLFQDDEGDSIYAFQDSELENNWVFNDSEVGSTPAHFIVYLPSVLAAKEDMIKSILNINRLPSKRYQIQYL